MERGKVRTQTHSGVTFTWHSLSFLTFHQERKREERNQGWVSVGPHFPSSLFLILSLSLSFSCPRVKLTESRCFSLGCEEKGKDLRAPSVQERERERKRKCREREKGNGERKSLKPSRGQSVLLPIHRTDFSSQLPSLSLYLFYPRSSMIMPFPLSSLSLCFLSLSLLFIFPLSITRLFSFLSLHYFFPFPTPHLSLSLSESEFLSLASSPLLPILFYRSVVMATRNLLEERDFMRGKKKFCLPLSPLLGWPSAAVGKRERGGKRRKKWEGQKMRERERERGKKWRVGHVISENLGSKNTKWQKSLIQSMIFLLSLCISKL